MLPTNTANASVFNIQASLSRDFESKKIDSVDDKKTKSFKIKAPNTIPPKSESMTFFVYSATMIASRDGRMESAESSMLIPSKLYR
ncbi:hypothetical protein [Sulfurimonas sp.]|uniref:hypothetical protein n=1 Tax=Sulfurimonas sp. TaxID=2022749 RepID=UPI0025DB9889|nr:hypothetical protein [Sulfurimonas sp.]